MTSNLPTIFAIKYPRSNLHYYKCLSEPTLYIETIEQNYYSILFWLSEQEVLPTHIIVLSDLGLPSIIMIQ